MEKRNGIRVNNPKLAFWISIFAAIVLYQNVQAQFSPALGQDQERDLFLSGLAIRYGLELPNSFFSKPIPAADLNPFFVAADSLAKIGQFTTYEAKRLELIRRSILPQRRSLFTWKNSEYDTEVLLTCNLLGNLKNSLAKKFENDYTGIINPGIVGNTGQLSFFSEISAWTQYSSDTIYHISDYQPFHGLPFNLYGRKDSSKVRSSDLFRGGIYYISNKRTSFEAGVDYLRQGPASFYPLTISGFCPPITYGRMRLNLGSIGYIHTIGLLKSQKDKSKYLYTHRLTFSIFKKIASVGLNEVIINGSTAPLAQKDSLKKEYYGEVRNIEPIYLIPFLPFKFAEHYNGDRDNAAISCDLRISIPRTFNWYCEIFIDDISSPWTILSNDFGNKWAFTIGGAYFGTLANRSVNIIAEYSRVEPWVYTHFYGGSHNFLHYGQSLGSPIGPNSDAFRAQVEQWFGPLFSGGIFFENIRCNPRARGGSITDVFQSDGLNKDSRKKVFLGSDYDSETIFGILCKYRTFDIFNVEATFGYSSKKRLFLNFNGGFSL